MSRAFLTSRYLLLQATDKYATLEEKITGEAKGEELRTLVKPFLLRREKKTIFGSEGAGIPGAPKPTYDEESALEDEITVLPPAEASVTAITTTKLPGLKSKKELVIWTYLTERQVEIYNAFLTTEEVAGVLNESASPLAALQVMKKICDHPDLLTKSLQGCQSLPLEELKM